MSCIKITEAQKLYKNVATMTYETAAKFELVYDVNGNKYYFATKGSYPIETVVLNTKEVYALFNEYKMMETNYKLTNYHKDYHLILGKKLENSILFKEELSKIDQALTNFYSINSIKHGEFHKLHFNYLDELVDKTSPFGSHLLFSINSELTNEPYINRYSNFTSNIMYIEPFMSLIYKYYYEHQILPKGTLLNLLKAFADTNKIAYKSVVLDFVFLTNDLAKSVEQYKTYQKELLIKYEYETEIKISKEESETLANLIIKEDSLTANSSDRDIKQAVYYYSYKLTLAERELIFNLIKEKIKK